MEEEVICAVPGCGNPLTKEQRGEKIAVCLECEEAGMHLCENCGREIEPERIRDGASLCKECEMNPSALEGTDYSEYASENYMY